MIDILRAWLAAIGMTALIHTGTSLLLGVDTSTTLYHKFSIMLVLVIGTLITPAMYQIMRPAHNRKG